MSINKNTAPYIENLIESCKAYPEIKNAQVIKKLVSIFKLMCRLKKQGDDEYRSVWITVPRGDIKDFGDYDEYLADGDVGNETEFKELWLFYYPDETKWYSFAVSRYEKVYYFYIDSRLIFQFRETETGDQAYDFHKELADLLLEKIKENINLAIQSISEYNHYVNKYLPYKKRLGRILRKDFWSVFPENKEDIKKNISADMIEILKKVQLQSQTQSLNYIAELSAADFFRICEIGYDANNYFSRKSLHEKYTPKEKYAAMADGRDCGLKSIEENSVEAFNEWYKTERHCGGHPWEICKGGNSTHISLFVEHNTNGWFFRMAGSSRTRVIETALMAVALYRNDVPFVLQQSEEIYRMISGTDYIGIVPEIVTPRYCHSLFPKEDKVIDFMNLGTKKSSDIINIAYWYPLEEVQTL